MPELSRLARVAARIAGVALAGVASPACGSSATAGTPSPLPSCAPLDYVVSPRFAGDFCVAPPCSQLTPAPVELVADGDTLYYSDRTQILGFDAQGQPVPIGAPPAETTTDTLGTSSTAQPEIFRFWLEPTRFVIVASDGNVYALAKDGSGLTRLGGPIPKGQVFAKDDTYVYEAMYTDGLTQIPSAIYRLPLAGGTLETLTMLGSLDPGALYMDATHLYVIEDATYRLAVYTKDGQAAPLPPLRPFARMPIGFDGTAFYSMRDHGGMPGFIPQEIDRELLSGQSTTLWSDGDLAVGASGPMAIVPPGGQGGYVPGGVMKAHGGGPGEATVLKLDATGAHARVCSTDPSAHFSPIALGARYGYAVVSAQAEGGAGATWGIARFAP